MTMISLALSVCNPIYQRRGSPPVITATTAPTLSAMDDSQTPADGYTAGSYVSTAGTIASAVETYYVNDVEVASTYDLAADDDVRVSVLVTDSVGNTRTFSTGTVMVTAGPALANQSIEMGALTRSGDTFAEVGSNLTSVDSLTGTNAAHFTASIVGGKARLAVSPTGAGALAASYSLTLTCDGVASTLSITTLADTYTIFDEATFSAILGLSVATLNGKAIRLVRGRAFDMSLVGLNGNSFKNKQFSSGLTIAAHSGDADRPILLGTTNFVSNGGLTIDDLEFAQLSGTGGPNIPRCFYFENNNDVILYPSVLQNSYIHGAPFDHTVRDGDPSTCGLLVTETGGEGWLTVQNCEIAYGYRGLENVQHVYGNHVHSIMADMCRPGPNIPAYVEDNLFRQHRDPEDGVHQDVIQFATIAAAFEIYIRRNILLPAAGKAESAQLIFNNSTAGATFTGEVSDNIGISGNNWGIKLDGGLAGLTVQNNTLVPHSKSSLIGGGKIGIGIGVDSVKDYNIYDRADTNGYYLTNQEDVDLATLFTLNSPNVIDNGDGTYDLTSVGSDPDPLIARNDVLACLTPLAAGPLDVTPRIGASTDTADWSTTVPGRVEAATSPVVATATRDDFQPTGANATINFTEFDGESVQESDYVVFFFSSSHTFNRTISASSSGWTMVEAVVPNDGYTRRGTLRAFIKKMGATPDTSLVLNGDSSGAWAMRGMVIRGYSAIDVTSVTATGANTAPDPPSITPVTADALILLAGTATGHFTADYTITAPSWDDVSLIKGDLSSDGLGTGFFSYLATGTITWDGSGAYDAAALTSDGATSGADSWAAIAMALTPA